MAKMTLAEKLAEHYVRVGDDAHDCVRAAVNEALERAATICQTSHNGKPCWSCADKIRALKGKP